MLLLFYRAFKRSEGFRGLSRMIGNSVRVVYGTLCHAPLDTTAKICGITLPKRKLFVHYVMSRGVRCGCVFAWGKVGARSGKGLSQ